MKAISQPVVKLVWHTPNPRRVIAIAARMTYSAKPVEQLSEDITEAETASSVRAILERHHWSVLRHVSFCFTVSGVSRALSHQLVRHAVGFAYEQRSQHYRVENDSSYIEPPTLSGNPVYEDAMGDANDAYRSLIAMGVPREDARMVLPSGIETQLVMTANAEAVLNLVKARACRVNTSEILSVAVQVRNIVKDIIPEMHGYLGPTCWSQGLCFEGHKYYKVCNRPWKPAVLWSPEFPDKIEHISVLPSKQGGPG